MEEVGGFQREPRRDSWCTDRVVKSKSQHRGRRPKQLEDGSDFLRWGYGWEAVAACFGIYS